MAYNEIDDFKDELDALRKIYSLKDQNGHPLVKTVDENGQPYPNHTIHINPNMKNIDFFELLKGLKALTAEDRPCAGKVEDFLLAQSLVTKNEQNYREFVKKLNIITSNVPEIVKIKSDRKNDIILPDINYFLSSSPWIYDDKSKETLATELFASFKQTIADNNLTKVTTKEKR